MSDGFGYNQLQVVRLRVQVDRQGSTVIFPMAVLPGESQKPRNGSRRPGLSPVWGSEYPFHDRSKNAPARGIVRTSDVSLLAYCVRALLRYFS